MTHIIKKLYLTDNEQRDSSDDQKDEGAMTPDDLEPGKNGGKRHNIKADCNLIPIQSAVFKVVWEN